MIPQGFWIAEFECFQKLWGAVMGTSPQNLPLGTGDLLPVYNISPNEILEFIRKFNEELQKQNTAFVGWAANLPTHEQLVYALRAGSTTEFCFGDDEVKLGDFAWYAENSDGKHHPVGTKKPNAWGIHDMHGSVYELTSKNLSEGDSKSRWSFFTRGGSIKSTQEECRWGVEAGFLLPRGTGSHHLGFRLVLVQEEESEPKKRK